MGMKLRLDAAVCVGHGRCYVLAPEVFDEDARGHCVPRFETVPRHLEHKARLGEENCPEGAITTEEEGR